MKTTNFYRYLFIALSLSGFLGACNSKTIEYEIIPLHHGIGELYIQKTIFFDTLSQWRHELDCDCCHMQKVRLSNTEFPLIQEKSWKYTQPDSVFQLTVSQAEKNKCDTGFQINQREINAQLKYVSNLYGFNPLWVYHQIEPIDGYDFIILGWEVPRYGRYNGQNLQHLLAITSIDGEKVTFDFSCRKQNCGNFLRRSFWLLKRIKIQQHRDS